MRVCSTCLGEERRNSTQLSWPSFCDMPAAPCLVLLDSLLRSGKEIRASFIAKLCKKAFQRHTYLRTEPVFTFTCILILVYVVSVGGFECGKFCKKVVFLSFHGALFRHLGHGSEIYSFFFSWMLMLHLKISGLTCFLFLVFPVSQSVKAGSVVSQFFCS